MSATPVTLLLLVAICLVSGLALFGNPQLIERWGLHIGRLRTEPYRYISAGFVHASLVHLLFNAITLYYFGPALELRLGSFPFGILYAGSLVGAHAWTHYKRRFEPGYMAVGASGAICGVLFGYALFEPWSTLLLFGIVPVPALVFALLFVGFSLWALRRGWLQLIAHEAHLGGAIAGLVITLAIAPEAGELFLRRLF